MGCTGSKTRAKRSLSDNLDAVENPAPGNTAVAGDMIVVPRVPYQFSIRLTPEAEKEIPDDPNASVVERTNVQYAQGALYSGDMKGRTRHGKGRLVWPDGTEFSGEWVNDVANGHGVLRVTGPEGPVYDGEWKDDKANGFGTLKQNDAAVYEGQWKDDASHGQGKETWPDGSSFTGFYENGRKEGRGVFEWTEKCKYDGEFHVNRIEGWGRYDWPDGRIYCGQWVDNKMHGFGWFFWPKSQIYHGQYVQDKKEGWGEFLWPDGKMYRGWWKSGKQSGVGVFRSPKGEEKWGTWDNGTRLNWLMPKEAEEKDEATNIPSEPEYPKWLQDLCQEALPEWYKERLHKGPSTNDQVPQPTTAPVEEPVAQQDVIADDIDVRMAEPSQPSESVPTVEVVA